MRSFVYTLNALGNFNLKTGTIIKSTGSWYRLLDEDDNEYDCRIRGKMRMEGIKSLTQLR